MAVVRKHSGPLEFQRTWWWQSRPKYIVQWRIVKKDLILKLDILAWWTEDKTENSNTNCNRMLRYNIRKMKFHEHLLGGSRDVTWAETDGQTYSYNEAAKFIFAHAPSYRGTVPDFETDDEARTDKV
jgi:hypothetical protein